MLICVLYFGTGMSTQYFEGQILSPSHLKRKNKKTSVTERDIKQSLIVTFLANLISNKETAYINLFKSNLCTYIRPLEYGHRPLRSSPTRHSLSFLSQYLSEDALFQLMLPQLPIMMHIYTVQWSPEQLGSISLAGAHPHKNIPVFLLCVSMGSICVGTRMCLSSLSLPLSRAKALTGPLLPPRH